MEIIPNKEKSSENELPISFYEYWKSVPRIKELNYENFNKLKQEIRNAIFNLLKEGIVEKHPVTKKEVRRHLLNAKEIKYYISLNKGNSTKNEKDEDKITFQNLYFHLNTLEKAGIIKIVDEIKIKKKLISYYGRTAKNYLLDDIKDKEELKLLDKKELVDFLLKINPNVPEQEIISVLTKIKDIKFLNRDFIISWLNEFGSEMDNFNLEFKELFTLINFLKIDDPEISKAIDELGKLLKLS